MLVFKEINHRIIVFIATWEISVIPSKLWKAAPLCLSVAKWPSALTGYYLWNVTNQIGKDIAQDHRVVAKDRLRPLHHSESKTFFVWFFLFLFGLFFFFLNGTHEIKKMFYFIYFNQNGFILIEIGLKSYNKKIFMTKGPLN